jgi:uncharacterized protein YxjI
MASNFFETNSYFIDQKVQFMKFENRYQIYNEYGAFIGTVYQKLTSGQKALNLLLSKTMLPFVIEIRDGNDELMFSISRDWTFILSKVNIFDAQGNDFGFIQQKFKLLKSHFLINNNNGSLIAEMFGNWNGWHFIIKNASGSQMGLITKKWAGAMKEIFTTADKYNVSVDERYASKENKIIMLANAISIDMLIKNRNKNQLLNIPDL